MLQSQYTHSLSEYSAVCITLKIMCMSANTESPSIDIVFRHRSRCFYYVSVPSFLLVLLVESKQCHHRFVGMSTHPQILATRAPDLYDVC